MWPLVEDYLRNSSIHGLRYLVLPGREAIERIFWLIALLISGWGLVSLARSSWTAFRLQAFAFVADTAYRDWNTSFPGVTLCETADHVLTYEYIQAINQKSENKLRLDPVIMRKFIFYFINFINAQPADEYDALDLQKISLQYRANCSSLMIFCSWRDQPFDCCSTFRPLNSELGPCFSANSENTKPLEGSALVDMTMNRHVGLGELSVQVTRNVKVYIDSAEEVPYHSIDNSQHRVITRGYRSKFLFTAEEVKNEPGLKDVSISSRNCAFKDELPLGIYSSYSYSACIVACGRRVQLQVCNCSHHLMPDIRDELVCKLKGLECLYFKQNEIQNLIKRCGCLDSCSKNEYEILNFEEFSRKDFMKKKSEINFSMAYLPSLRLQRNVVRSHLDLVVSAGGIAGLLVGASLLSIIEIFMYFFVRIFYDKKRNK